MIEFPSDECRGVADKHGERQGEFSRSFVCGRSRPVGGEEEEEDDEEQVAIVFLPFRLGRFFFSGQLPALNCKY